jgi:hypothetical protein
MIVVWASWLFSGGLSLADGYEKIYISKEVNLLDKSLWPNSCTGIRLIYKLFSDTNIYTKLNIIICFL